MDSDDEIGIDSGNVSSDEDYDFMQVDEIQRSNGTSGADSSEQDYPYEVLTTDEIVQHMLDCIAEVNSVVEVSVTFCYPTVHVLVRYPWSWIR